MDTFIAAMRDADRLLDEAKAKIADAVLAAQTWPAGAHAAADLGAEAERLTWSATSALFKGNKHGWATSANDYDQRQRAAR